MSSFSSQTTLPISRLCRSCGETLTENRLKAMPGSTVCVPCLERAGDVPLLKRLDELVGDNERVETFFYDDPRFTDQIRHTSHKVADQQAFDIVLGDDSHLSKRDTYVAVDVARSMTTEFEEDDSPGNGGLVGRPLTLPVYDLVAA